ncbi:cytochrome P450 1A1 [Protopterus annectens]|uniref:cytochrome P450 1A1 n=1 Tax=Protopterus annectens TaxID=7888 RepID=UPI001CFA71B3|nr:cytochrome P450 1A1 [Protopterus annectens]
MMIWHNLLGSESITLTEILLAITCFCIFCLIIRTFQKKVPQGLKLPLGPTGLPLIGNAHQLGKNPHLTLSEMHKTYGDVMQIKIGMRPVVVLSGYETIRQALIKQGDDFAGRPDLYSFRYINNGMSLAFSKDMGEVWKARRKLAKHALREFSADECKNTTYSCILEEHISQEAEYLITLFSDLMEKNGRFDPFRNIVVSVANVICALCFGKRYSHDHQRLLSLVTMSEEFAKIAGSGNQADFIPILQYLPNPAMNVFIDLNRRFNAFVQEIVKEHYKLFDKDNITDITDFLIEHCQDKKMDENANLQLSDEKVVGIVNDLFGAGFDTVTTALCWSLTYLVAFPEIQKKIHEELDEKIGQERKPRLSDRSHLPYLEAFIAETFRYSSFVPFTIPHCTTKNVVLNGYFIPQATCVFINQWQVNHDNELWKNPFNFCPERFLNADGKSVNKGEIEKVMLFGMGKRRCIGESIAQMEVFLFLATMLHQMEFQKAPGEEVDLTPIYGLSMKNKQCNLRAVPHVQIKGHE